MTFFKQIFTITILCSGIFFSLSPSVTSVAQDASNFQEEYPVLSSDMNRSEADRIDADILSPETRPEPEESLAQAEHLIQGYFYEEALALLDGLSSEHAADERVLKLRENCLAAQESLTPYADSIPHVFFHSLIVDTEKAFDGDRMSNGYNAWMTTVDEFEKMMTQMHEKDYVLIDIGEIWETVTDESGDISFRKKKPLLPAGKKPFILSVDDVNYYPYMEKDGFADRLELDEQGEVVARYWNGEDAEFGAYDVVPILDKFIREHPDFSYRGAKGILALTGYAGTLGYRTQELEAEDYADRVQAVTKVIDRLKETGWRFASHGYSHLHTAKITLERLQEDTTRWKDEVGLLVGDTEIYIFPYGEEISYKDGSEKLKHLREEGFHVFCGVDSRDFLRVRKNYVRQMRRNLDGYSMFKRPERLQDLFNVEEVLDPARPPLK